MQKVYVEKVQSTGTRSDGVARGMFAVCSPARWTQLWTICLTGEISIFIELRTPYRALWTTVSPKFAPKVSIPADRSPYPSTCLIPGPVRPMMPNVIWVRYAVFPQCTEQTDQPTDRRTHVRTYRPTDRRRIVHRKVRRL